MRTTQKVYINVLRFPIEHQCITVTNSDLAGTVIGSMLTSMFISLIKGNY